MAALEKISNSRDGSKFEAKGLILQLQSFEFRFSLKFFNFILSIIHTVHNAFQSENANLADSIDLI